MSLQNTTVKLMNDYLQAFPYSQSKTRLSLAIPSTGNPTVVYLDVQDIILGHTISVGGGARISRIDPNLIDTSSALVGDFESPVSNAGNAWLGVGDYDPTLGTQRLFTAISTGSSNIQELDVANPELLVDADVWPNARVNGTDNGKTNVDDGYCRGDFQALGWAIFPELDQAIVTGARCRFGGVLYDNVICLFDLATGDGVPLASTVPGLPTSAVPGRYAASENAFNQVAVFSETEIRFVGVQFIADDDSTHEAPKGVLMFGSDHYNTGGPPSRVYIRLNDYNPTGKVAAPGTPNRIHLRETLFSRMEYQEQTIPAGDPLAPTDAVAGFTVNFSRPDFLFTSRGSRRLAIYCGSGIVNPNLGDTTITEYSLAAAVDGITKATEIGSPKTNSTMRSRVVVTGSLGERIANVRVDFTLERQTTVAEVLAVTPSLGETVQVANVPIDRTNLYFPDFDVFKDGVAMTEGAGAGEYQVNEATGEITFGAAEPVGGSVYTINYAHPDAPASPPHGTLVIGSTFTDVNGEAETRITYPDDDTLENEADLLTATTA